MHDLAHRPAAFAVRCVEMRVVQAFHRSAHFGRGSRNLVDRLLAPSRRHLRGHLKFSNGVAQIHCDFLLGQPDVSLDYSDSRSCRSMPPAGKSLSNLAARIPSRGGGNATIPDCVVSRRRSAESNRWRNIQMYNVLIIGSGCAGLTAAIYAARANLKPLVLDGHEPGGQLSLTTHVENYPGFPDGIMGPELIENMRKQAKKFGAEFKAGVVNEVDVSKRPFRISAGKDTYEAQALIVATGASARLLGLKGEKELIGRGVSTCATCDRYFFRDKPIAVIGGGDSAMEEANFLSRYASKVHLIHRRNDFRASKIMIDRARANEKVEFVTPFAVEDIHAPEGHVEGVSLRNPQTKETRDIALDGVFVAIGHDPNTIVFKGKLAMDSNGYLLAKHGSLT